MVPTRCPTCSRELAAGTCPQCGLNGHARKPIPADLIERARRDFDEAQFVAGMREILDTGGLELDDFIGDLEREAAAP